MSEKQMRVSADELAAIVSIPWREGERYTFDRIQTWHDDGRLRAVFLDREGEPGSVVLRREVDPLLDLVRRLARDLAEERKASAIAYGRGRDDLASEQAAVLTSAGPIAPDDDLVAEILAPVLSVKVQWIDDGAAARVTPGQVEAYLKRTGWTEAESHTPAMRVLAKGEESVGVPLQPGFRDYSRRMSDLIRTLADVEQRSPLAVWLDLLAEAT